MELPEQPHIGKEGSVTSQTTGAGQAVSIKLIGMDQPFFVALAVVISVVAALFCFFTEMREERRVYFTMRCEGFIEQAAFEHKTIPYSICSAREK
jgi:hypothetical protein